MSTPNLESHLITAKEAESYIPASEDWIGNDDLITYLTGRLSQPFEGDANVLIQGDPGTGKTAFLQSYLRKRFNNPDLFSAVELERFRKHRPGASEHTVRLHQSMVEGSIYLFVQIDGATDSPNAIESKLTDLTYGVADHKVLLVDELGELYFRGLEERLRPILTSSENTVFATAQNFHSKRRTDSATEEKARLQALLRRFSNVFYTQNPSESEMLRLLVKRIKSWQIALDEPSTMRLLIQKSGGVVGYALRPLIAAIDSPLRRLTRSIVLAHDVNPGNR